MVFEAPVKILIIVSTAVKGGEMADPALNAGWWTISAALLTPTIAVIAVYVAYRQWKTNDDKLRLDLFDRRYSVYVGVSGFLVEVAASGEVEEENVRNLYQATGKARFLFGDEIDQYVDDVRSRAIRCTVLKSNLRDKEGFSEGDRKAFIRDYNAEIGFFVSELKTVDHRFHPYLAMPHKLGTTWLRRLIRKVTGRSI